MKFKFVSESAEETIALGRKLGELLRPYDLICLYGEMGAGKTAFARGVGAGWGSIVRVTSPTYLLINQYPRPDGVVLYHLDCYRLESEAAAITSGLEDILEGDGAILIEWPERVTSFLPHDRLNISIQQNEQDETEINQRTFTFAPSGDRAHNLTEAIYDSCN